ncbi:hypothetical protein QFC19_000029 [Naganishia cerealis]|uniref:Uncharacterized protein n=1 Tax=Naganishia cerealis TaxID=610337 RepID=A0ACC2WRW6_9TREE|nr:hypothetical protein QFC19_000029 [Naganishia cerealis]
MEFFAAYPPAKTLVTARPFDAGSRTRPDAFADRNDDRRASASSMNKKPAAAPMRLKRTASSAAAEPPRMKNADQLLAKWNKVSQPESDDSDDLNLDFSQERQGRPIKPYPRRSESQTSPPRAKRKSTSYPDMTANHSSSGKHTRKPASFPAADADATDSEAYMVLSQDMEYIASSVPSKNLRLEVSIGVGDGASLADSEGEPSLSTTVTRLDFRSGNKTKKNQSSKSGILPVLRLPISIAYSSDEEGGVRDDSFLQVLGRSAQRKMTAMTVGTKTSSGKGNSKNSMVDGNKSGTGKNKAGRRAAAIDPPRTSNGTGKGKPKGNAKSQGKVIVSTSEESSDDDSDDDVPALRFDRDDYSEPTPRPKKRPMEAAKATTAGVSGRKRKIRHLQDDSNGIASSDDDTDQRSTPMQRRKLDVGGTSAAIARAGGSRSAKGSTLESGKRVSTVTRRGTIQSRARSTTPPPSSSQKTAPHPLLGAATSTTTGKGKDPLRKVTLPDGFPSPMRAPIRPNERLLRAAAAESSSSSSSSSPSRPRAGKSQEGNKERAPDVGPNGGSGDRVVAHPLGCGNRVKMLPVFECVPADAPTLQLSMEKVPQLIG